MTHDPTRCYVCEGMANDIDRLERWKAEATAVINQWESMWERLGRPGQLGQHKSDAVVELVSRLTRPAASHADADRAVIPISRDPQGVPLYLYRCARCGIQTTTYSAVEANTWHACDCTATGRRPRFKRIKFTPSSAEGTPT